MIRRTTKPDGLPFRVYERRGVRVYSIGMKSVSGEWSFRYSCSIADRAQIAELRSKAITQAGAKRQRGQDEQHGMIEWIPELRATIDVALSVKRNKLAGAWFLFGNLDGQKYTKGGWKATLSKLMTACVVQAEEEKQAFRPFSLQDCRPKGVSDKMGRGDTDVMEATMHTSERMVRQIYDRRRVRVAKSAR